MAKDINEAVREVCLSFPQAEEFISHGAPNFRVHKGKIFAVYAVNTHGDGRIALWLNMPPGAQAIYVEVEPNCYFVPPYVGPRGWLGVQLDKGLSWTRIASLVREAYEHTAPTKLHAAIGKTISIQAPKTTLAAEDFDPMQAPKAQKLLQRLREICLALPETSETMQYGYPIWRAGKKTFALMYFLDKHVYLGFWTGLEMQDLLIADPRMRLHPYKAHQGWVSLDVSGHCDWKEIGALSVQSYRHFALKRMLTALDA